MPITQEQTFSNGHFFLLFFLSFFCVWCCGDDDTIFKLNRTEITCEDKFSRCPEQHPCTLYLIFYYGFYRFWMFFVWPVIEISYWAFLKNIRSARSRAFAFARLESWCVTFFLGCLRPNKIENTLSIHPCFECMLFLRCTVVVNEDFRVRIPTDFFDVNFSPNTRHRKLNIRGFFIFYSFSLHIHYQSNHL